MLRFQGGQGAHPVSAFSHLLSAQNTPYLGVASSEPLGACSSSSAYVKTGINLSEGVHCFSL